MDLLIIQVHVFIYQAKITVLPYSHSFILATSDSHPILIHILMTKCLVGVIVFIYKVTTHYVDGVNTNPDYNS